jgi:hypothetical protein
MVGICRVPGGIFMAKRRRFFYGTKGKSDHFEKLKKRLAKISRGEETALWHDLTLKQERRNPLQ